MEEEIVLMEENDIEEINIEEENYSGEPYVLPIASKDVLGGIKVGKNLTIDADGTLNATGELTGEYKESDPTVPQHVKNIKQEDIDKWNNCTDGVVEESDPTVPAHVKAITQEQITKWDNGTGDVDLTAYAKKSEVPTKTSQLTNDSNFINSIKTINGQSLEGEGNIIIESGDIDISGLTSKLAKVLYENANGSNSSVTLSETSANFKYLDIFCKSTDNTYTSVRIHEPNGKRVTVTSGWFGSAAYYKNAVIDVIDTTVRFSSFNASEITGQNLCKTASSNTIMYIVKVVGYYDEADVVLSNGNAVNLTDYVKKTELPTKTSQFENDEGYINKIKTINGQSIIGEGNITIQDSNGNIPKPIELTELVVFGDSWSDLTVADAIWSTKVADGLNLTLHNYAKNGAGFIKPDTNLIKTQINTFINSDINKEAVKYIIIMGGINDYRNGITYSALAPEIISCIQTLKDACYQAKILFVNNIQYPYNASQDRYWHNLIKEITKEVLIPTYNMSGMYSHDLFNSNNYFHLTKEGQKFMAKNILSCLTGGELISYIDERVIENTTGKISYRTEKVSSNMVNISFRIETKASSTSYTFSLNSGDPDLPYNELIEIEGNVLRGYKLVIADVDGRKIVIASDTALAVNTKYDFSVICPLV